MDSLPPSGFQFSGDDYGPVEFPGSVPNDMQVGMTFAGGGPVFPQNQRGGTYGMSSFHLNYSQQTSMPSMSSLPSSSFRSRFSDYSSDQTPHLPMPLPSSASGMISDRLPSFSTIVSNSGSSVSDIGKSSQTLYSSISGQQHAFLPSGSRVQNFDSSYTDQIAGKNYSKSPSLGSTSPGISSNSNYNSIPPSSIMQHSSHNGSSQHLSSHSPRSYKEDAVSQQQYLTGGMHLDRHGGFIHGGISQNSAESMMLPKFKHKYLSHSQHMVRRHIGPFKFFIIGKSERPSVFNRGTQTKEEPLGELKIKIPKAELYRSESENEFVDEVGRVRRHHNLHMSASLGIPRGSQRITFPYDPLPSQGGEYSNYNANAKMKTIISPSFMEAAGKATMTTCVANKATIVTVGIVSRPPNLIGAEPTGSINQKGIMATGNHDHMSRIPYKHQNSEMSGGDPEGGEEHLENYEHLLEERKAKARDLEQERMEPMHMPRKRFSNQNQIFESAENFDSIDIKDGDKIGADGKLLCRFCDRRFRYPSQLKDHMQSHSGHRPYMCTECGMDFMKEHHLKAHQFTHTGLKPFTCDACGRSFNQKANLQRHKLIHETTRTFKCNTCGKMFTQPQTLKAHQVVHADRKPFECSICGKEFGRYHNLQGHMHMHTNTKPYVCFCGSTFTLKGNLNRHKKVKHGLNETTDVMEEDAVNFLSSLSERARDDHNVDGEVDSLSPGSGADSNDGKSGRKGRKSIPRKITQEEEEEDKTAAPNQTQQTVGEEPEKTVLLPVQPAASVPKPFVIQNPDTDDDIEGEDGELAAQHLAQISNKENHLMMNPVTNMMSFQPLNVGITRDQVPVTKAIIKVPEEEQSEVERRPRRQSQRRSPKVHTSDIEQSQSSDDDTGDNNDNADTDWVPGSRRRSRGKSDPTDKKH
ncbi:hypothetical protein BsWGS_00615 [Bradybaena similaris]